MKIPENEMKHNRILYEKVYDDTGLPWIPENIDLLRRILDCIRNGDAEQMETIVGILPEEFQASFGDNPIRHTRNLVISLVQLMGIAAIETGVPAALCIRHMEDYVKRTEEADSFETIRTLADEAKMRFCLLTADRVIPKVEDYRIRDSIVYIREHITKKITRTELADRAGMSEAYFSKKFHALTGKTPGEYIRIERIRQAKRMLTETDESLAEIAGYLAFTSQNYFQTVFKQAEGCTPLEYRLKHR